ncbi:MAG: hypothetical protein DHS20C02_05620 [Micavibrio sp.]|nr:MAG: hypothetical protein DHS20C02_05620 [Micavibrio sp.]
MKLLILSPYFERLKPALEKHDDEWIIMEDKITPGFLKENNIDMGVSYGYRHILKQNVLDVCPFINMHISYLPWNRGADPNIWSWIEDTPKGITIHYIDEGIDTGDIIAQREVSMGPDETLATSYEKLQEEVVELFYAHWSAIRAGEAPRHPQQGQGSLHYVADKEKIESLLYDGFNTRVSDIVSGQY